MIAGILIIGLALNSFVSPPGVSTYTQQHEIEVGDVPGHKVRIFEIRAKFTDEAPRYAGVKVVETAHEGPATRRHHHPRPRYAVREATDLKTGLSGVKTDGEYWFEK